MKPRRKYITRFYPEDRIWAAGYVGADNRWVTDTMYESQDAAQDRCDELNETVER